MPLEHLDVVVIDRSIGEGGKVVAAENFLVILALQIGQRLGCRGDGGGLDRHRTQQIVRAVVASRFVDGQDLHHPQAVLFRPGGEFLQGLGVTDAKIVLSANGE